MACFRVAIMNYNSFQLILIQFLVNIMIIINSVSCEGVDI